MIAPDKFRMIGGRQAAGLREMFGLSQLDAARLTGLSLGAVAGFEREALPLDAPWQSIAFRLHGFYEAKGGYWRDADLHEGLHGVFLVDGVQPVDARCIIRAALALMGYRASRKPWARPVTRQILVARVAARCGKSATAGLGQALVGRKPLTHQLEVECFYELKERGGRHGAGCVFYEAEGGGWRGVCCDPNGCWW